MKPAESTDPGIGDASPPKSLKTLRPQPDRMAPASLLSTQVGIGAVRIDANGQPVFERTAIPSLSLSRFAVRPGAKLGELILTALDNHENAPPGVAVITLQPTSVADARAIDALGRP